VISDQVAVEEEMNALAALCPPDAERIYRTDPQAGALTALLYRPPGWQASDRRAAIVAFCGGGWRLGTAFQFAPQAVHWRQKGHVVILPWYRVRERHGTSIPDCIRDARSVLRWVSREADTLGIDPDRIVVGGGSAGGHLAAAAPVIALDHPEEAGQSVPAARALLLFNPALDLSSTAEAMVRLTGGLGLTRDALAYCDPGPHLQLPYPPTLIQHGTADTVVPYTAAESFTARLSAMGGVCRLVGYEGRGHGFFNLTRGEADFQETLRVADEFVDHWIGKAGAGSVTLRAP